MELSFLEPCIELIVQNIINSGLVNHKYYVLNIHAVKSTFQVFKEMGNIH